MNTAAGRNPGRRNRHAGTAAHGHGQDNEMVIPNPSDRVLAYFLQLGNPICIHRRIADMPMRFYIQPPLPGWYYPCSVDDICALLALSPMQDWAEVDFIVLRQPTRKQRVLCPVWGRAVFFYEGVASPGPAVVLEAQSLTPIKWGRGLSISHTRELDRLRADGHSVRLDRRHWLIEPNAAALRHTQLFRTLLHEIGHHVDYRQTLASGMPWRNHTHQRKEDFAHRYAQTLFDALQARGDVPFAPVPSCETCLEQGLRQAWFDAPVQDSPVCAQD